jgi:hypothetical protein
MRIKDWLLKQRQLESNREAFIASLNTFDTLDTLEMPMSKRAWWMP